jgi:lambda repressor-like predicted transcriptional regulator
MTVPYRKQCSSPFEVVQTVFAEAERQGMSVQDVSKRSGYPPDTVKNMRRPQVRRSNGSGLNPSLRMIIDMAQAVGFKIVAVPIDQEGNK